MLGFFAWLMLGRHHHRAAIFQGRAIGSNSKCIGWITSAAFLLHFDRGHFAAGHADHGICPAQDRRRSAQALASIPCHYAPPPARPRRSVTLYLVALFDQQAGIGRRVFIVACGG